MYYTATVFHTHTKKWPRHEKQLTTTLVRKITRLPPPLPPNPVSFSLLFPPCRSTCPSRQPGFLPFLSTSCPRRPSQHLQQQPGVGFGRRQPAHRRSRGGASAAAVRPECTRAGRYSEGSPRGTYPCFGLMGVTGTGDDEGSIALTQLTIRCRTSMHACMIHFRDPDEAAFVPILLVPNSEKK